MTGRQIETAVLELLSHGQRQSLAYICDTLAEKMHVYDHATIDALGKLCARGMLVREDDNRVIWYQLPEHDFR